MTMKGLGPCCCTEGCDYFYDEFNQTGNPGGTWTETAGDWIGVDTWGFIAMQVSTANALLLNSTAQTVEASGKWRVRVSIIESGADITAGKYRLYFGYVDSDNYNWVEAVKTAGTRAGTFALWKRVLGVETKIEEVPVTWPTTTEISICAEPDRAVCSFASYDSALGITYSAKIIGAVDCPVTICGIGTGDTVSGPMRFRGFGLAYHYDDRDDCPTCDCPDCPLCVTPPTGWLLEVSGTGSPCLDGAWVLECPAGGIWGPTWDCEWMYKRSSPCGAYGTYFFARITTNHPFWHMGQPYCLAGRPMALQLFFGLQISLGDCAVGYGCDGIYTLTQSGSQYVCNLTDAPITISATRNPLYGTCPQTGTFLMTALYE